MSSEAPVDPAALREEVKSKYREVALNPHGEFHFHTGRPLAARLGYPAPLAQGGVITGVFNAIVAHDLPGPGSVFLNVNWNFRRAVCIGDTITGEVEVLSVRADKPIVELRTTVTNQDGAVCLDGTALVYRRPLE